MKVFLANTANIKLIQSILKRLDSVSVVNVTDSKNGKNLTVYKEHGHAIANVRSEVKEALDDFFKGISKGNYSVYNKTLFSRLNADHPDVGALVMSGFKHANNEAEYRHALDDFRLAIELLLKKILGNEKSLENQREFLLPYMAEKGISVEIRNVFFKLLDTFCKYQNTNVKHGNSVNNMDLGIMIDYSVFFIKTLLSF
ncbi:MAG: hypothetical protein MJZ41_01135 [Bacteroidaceae bacterium]|nr:hypothetical protein [Bacteroidaceae bacterium]